MGQSPPCAPLRTIAEECHHTLPRWLLSYSRWSAHPTRAFVFGAGLADGPVCVCVCVWARLRRVRLPLQYRATKKVAGAHGDSIWSVAWAGPARLVTGSLDEKVKTWYVGVGAGSA